MAFAEFLASPVRSPSQQRPLPPLPYKDGVDGTCGTVPARVLRKHGHGRAAAMDARGTMDSVSYSHVWFRMSCLIAKPRRAA